MKWKVETKYSYGWDDAGWKVEEDRPLVFDSEEAANKAIDEFVKDVKEAVRLGLMDTEVDRSIYRAVPVKEAL